MGKETGTTYCFGCKDFTHNFRPQEVKMINKVLREESNYIVCRSQKSRFWKQKHNNKKQFNILQTDVIKLSIKTCVKYRKNTENLKSKISKTKNGTLIMQSKCPECGIKKSRFVKEQEVKNLLSNLGIKTPLSQIQLLNVLF